MELGAELVHGPTSALGQFVQEHGLPIRKELTWAQGDGDLLPVPPRTPRVTVLTPLPSLILSRLTSSPVSHPLPSHILSRLTSSPSHRATVYCAYYFGEEKKLMRSTELADDIEHVNAVLYELANVPDVEMDRYDSDTTLYHVRMHLKDVETKLGLLQAAMIGDGTGPLFISVPVSDCSNGVAASSRSR